MRYALLLFFLLLTACSTTKDYVRDTNSPASVTELTTYARTLIGTPYKYGGSSPKTGFDCSGFVDHVFQRAAGVSLPHNSQQISRHGSPIKSSQLREGDLVFYNTNHDSYSHVGIYLGNSQFIHAPSSGGKVRIENMTLDYWKKHYNGARRITL